ncbi:unnamed protein product [Polarella glacialis]|uniref:Lipoxygenase domain-containing protein n=1 Tax=Polarella glacialis TaxID=89957 RepID=A0A813DHA3_POLGL|nr:unnamed protein product [Polarella glacialis]
MSRLAAACFLLGSAPWLGAVLPAAADDASEGQCDAAGQADGRCSPAAQDSSTCAEGFFLSLTKQPDLALRHFVLGSLQASVPVVKLSKDGCAVEYAVSCTDGSLELQQSQTQPCADSVKLAGPALGRFGGSVEVCATQGTKLQVLQPLLDLTFDFSTKEGLEVEGCISLSTASALPHLSAVRGGLEMQQAALVARKHEVGGCPTWTSLPEDAVARGDDFVAGGHSVLAVTVKQYQRYLVSQAKELKDNGPPAEESMFSFSLIGAMIALHDFKNTEAYLAFTKANCGVAIPLGIGVMAPAKFADAAAAAGDPAQPRQYVGPWASGVSDTCFHPTLPLFLGSGSPEHTQTRRMWDAAGLATMHEGDFADLSSSSSWMRMLRDAVGMKEPTEEEVAGLIAPLLFERVFRKRPTEKEAAVFAQYATFGKLCIKSAMIAKGPWLPGKIREIRSAVLQFALDSPTAKQLDAMLQEPEYADIRRLYEKTGEPVLEVAVRNLADATLFAGLVGTTDMTWKCTKYLFRDHSHVRMFRRSPTDYLWELMRIQPAVQGFTSVLPEKRSFKMYGEDVELPAGTPYKFSNSMGNRDPLIFTDPANFNQERDWSEMGEMLSWNGKLKYVVERNYTGAPRHCPGHDLSVKIAAHVCEHLTRPLHEWGEKPQDSGVKNGIVKILAPGSLQGRVGVVAYFDFYLEKHCVIDRFIQGASMGCYSDDELEVVQKTGGIAHTLDEELAMCPSATTTVVHMVAHYGIHAYQMGYSNIVSKLLMTKAPEIMTPDWADDYMVALYAGITHLTLRMYGSRHSDSVRVPTSTGSTPIFRVGNLYAPDVDIDHPHFLPVEWFVPQNLFDMGFLPSFNCFHGSLRTMPWDDMLNHTDRNQWHTLFKNARDKYKSKKDWVLSFYETYRTQDNVPVWPVQENDFTNMFWKQDEWDDGLEHMIAFNLIGAHRLEVVEKGFKGESLQFVIRLNEFHAIETRPHFARYGGDLYFNAEGLPIMLETPDGRQVQRGDKDWQYWKFAWRSALITIITLVDHLHLTHFRVGNVLASAVRKSLSPSHPIRRFLSVFTFGSIFVNMNAMHTLIGPSHVLHRSSPFKDFEALSTLVPEHLKPPTDQFKSIVNDSEFQRLPKMIQETPYYQDGRLLIGAIKKLVKRYSDIYRSDMCTASGVVSDPELKRFRDELVAENAEAHYVTPFTAETDCAEFFDIIVYYLWTVTGWHRHVGTVGDYFADPDLASFSWKEGEAYARPLQHMIMSTVAAFTATAQPKLIEDYTHLFKGIDREERAVAAMQEFQAELREVQAEIGRRNHLRLTTQGFKNVYADPGVVECSVAV